MLAFYVETFDFQSVISKNNNKDQGTEKCNFVCCFVWVGNFFSHI